MEQKIRIFTGHYGSGKTTAVLNEALDLAAQGKRVIAVDLDTVNPYFRLNDERARLEAAGVEVIAPQFAGSNLDIPSVPADFMKIFSADCDAVFIDIGGDDDGAVVLRGYRERFEEAGYQMILVVNLRRPLTQTCRELEEAADSIERASGLKVTQVVNNTNVGKTLQKKPEDFPDSELRAFAERRALPIYFPRISRFLEMPWEK